ncbi:hypothetical protein EJB05_21798 [Eragrostis curvula]|uniref:Terpene synthase N-terminal domain-containing protein n=1 Tax=Eragrostis curvula TaxID=38414 RepID=A0A5J9V3W1_9POAL|nr:hypothetical protein EJB05_21798 [Eragrostis curvula]
MQLVFSTAALPPVALLWRPTTEKLPQTYRPIRAQRRQHGIQIPGESRTEISHRAMHTKELEDRIRVQLLGAKHQPSSYDTAWVSMVPAQCVPQAPRFPRFVEWILQNQQDDGSWGLGHLDPYSLGKDAINSTLACILALKKWNLGDEHIRKGLHFIGNNSSCITDENCDTPIGFNIIFSGMIMFGMELGLEFPIRQSDLDGIFRLREMELQRSWLQKEEEIIMDTETCALAFRILRMHGYNVSSDVFSHFAEESRFHNSVQGHLTDTKTLLELYNASQVRIMEEEQALENIGSWTSKLLKQQLSSNRLSRSLMTQEVEYSLKLPFYSATLELLEHKWNVEHFSTNSIKMRKSAYLVHEESTDHILALANEEFSLSQSLHQQELSCIESWWKEVGLDKLKFSRRIPLNIYTFLASTVFPREFPAARDAWIKNCFLTTAMDDFVEDGGSTEELENLVALIEKWDAHTEIGFCSEQVEILFSAIYRTNSQIGAKAAGVQNREVIGHIAQIWLDLLKASMVEVEWRRNSYVPTMEEYMPPADLSFAVDPILVPGLYLVGPKISENMVSDPAYHDLLRLTSICGRLLNDLHTYKKESSQGYINSVLLCALRDGGSIEAAEKEIWRRMVASRRQLLSLVLRESSPIPRLFREIFWNMCKAAQLFYLQVYDFRSLHELVPARSS